ncbi:hypothetical protein HWX16_23035 [Ochrobactrum intermedium]|uniref:hypothetical protein n=1 Tax=Brucella intermedia TaxID=94625 RepID=UPI00159CA20E|nr:hypothetical protein [Brucella intermedia]NVM43163.1 hypothetical protein [Brucella intermedia]
MKKATNLNLTAQYLQQRTERLAGQGYQKPKWIGFCETVLRAGLTVRLYEARRTVSKYVTVSNSDGRSFKVRFSNHKPIAAREAKGDCDFFVGVTNQTVTTTSQALAATLSFFGIREAA